MNIGEKLYYYRNKVGLTQEQLAHGICSVSYLSKIENNKCEASREVLELLVKKLGISLEDDNQEKLFEITILLEEWFEIIVNTRNKKESTNKKEMITKKIQEINDLSTIITYHLIDLRYELSIYNIEEANIIIKKLNPMQKYFTQENLYFYYYFLGLYKYIKGQFIASLDDFKQAEYIDNQINVRETELYYLLALVHSKLYHVTSAIYYSQLAVEAYNHKMYYFRSIESQLILAINYIRIQNFDKANYYLFNSLKIAKNIDNDYLIGRIKHNLGFLHSKLGKHKEAISFYLDSLYHKKDNLEDYTHTIYSLVKEYISINHIEEAEKWLQKGLEIVGLYNYKQNEMKLKVLYFRLGNGEYLKYIEKEVIPYFLKNKERQLVSEYAEILGDYFSSIYQYKKSSTYYKLANDSRKEILM